MADGNIVERLAAIEAAMKAVPKKLANQQQGWQSQSIDDIVNELKPLLGEHQVVLFPRTLDRTYDAGAKGWVATVLVEYVAKASDGSEVVAVVPAVGHDMGDKAMQKAMTYAYKTFVKQLFCIAEDDPDAETVVDGGRVKSSRAGDRSSGGSRGSAPGENVSQPGNVRTLPSPSDDDVARHPSAEGRGLRRDQAIAARARELGLSEEERQDAIWRVSGGRTRSGKDLKAGEGTLVLAELELIAKAKARGK